MRIAVTAAIFALLAAGCGNNDNSSGAPNPAAIAPPSEHAKPRPQAKVSGTCNYSLGRAMDGSATFTSQVQVTNTGNIAITVRVTVGWPQYGFRPVTAKQAVTLDTKHTSTLKFRRPATTEQTSRLQASQTHHGEKTGCAYKGKILGTSGPVH
jgi:hypothetical protein